MKLFTLPLIATRASRCLLACLCAASVVACSDDDAPALRPTLPCGQNSPVRTIEHLGTAVTGYDWSFGYADGRLVSADGVMRDVDENLDKSYRYTSQLYYGPQAVGVGNSSGETVQVELNAEGYISRMTVNRNIYNFSYTDGRLTGWSKVVFENSFGQVEQYTSSATLSYTGGDLSRIVYVGPTNEAVTLTFTASVLPNTNGLLPEGVAQEMGCLGFEHLHYAGLLGKPTAHLVERVTFAHSATPADDHALSFEYGMAGGNITLCTYHPREGGIVSVSYTY